MPPSEQLPATPPDYAKMDIDGNGVVNANDAIRFMTAFNSAVDYDAALRVNRPVNVAGLVASVSGTTVSLSWQPAQAPTNALYVTRDGSDIATAISPGQTSYTDQNVAPGQHSYAVHARNHIFSGPYAGTYAPTTPALSVSATVAGSPPVPSAGWTDLTPPPGSVVVYVAASGNDSNPGTQAAPFKTIERGLQAMRQGQPDQCLLRAGDTYSVGTIDLNNKGSGNSTSYAVLGVWGATAANPRAKIRSSGSAFNLSGCRGVAFVDLDVQPSSGHPNNGFWTPNGNNDILYEGLYVSGFGVNIASHAVTSGARINNTKIRRSVVVDPWSSLPQSSHCVFMGEQYGLIIEGNYFDRAGRDGGEQTLFKHSCYLSDSEGNAGPSTVIGNVHADSCADSIQVRTGGFVSNNLGLRNPVHMTWGGGAAFEFNIALDARDISSEHKRGIGFSLHGSGPVRYNLCAFQKTGTEAITAFDMNNYSGQFTGNTVEDWKAPGGQGWATAVQWNGGGGNVTCDGNRLRMPNIGVLWRHEDAPFGSRFVYRNSDLYTSTPPGGVGGYLPFSRGSGQGNDWPSWKSLAGEANSTFHTARPASPAANIGDYLQFIGIAPGTDPIRTYMTECRKQSRMNWRTQLEAATVNAWIRTKFGMPANPPANP
jgi:hypothetical protein